MTTLKTIILTAITIATAATVLAYADISDGRKVTINGIPLYTLSTNGYIRITDYWYNNGNLNDIPGSEIIKASDRSYFFEGSPNGAPTGTTITGNANGITATPLYARFYDDSSGWTYGFYGSAYMHGSQTEDYPFSWWVKYVPIGLFASNSKWVTAEHGQPLYASANTVGDWEIMMAGSNNITTWADVFNGRLNSGDTIVLRSWDANQSSTRWIAAEHGALNYVVADRTTAYDWEHFTISKTSGSGAIGTNDTVSLLDHDASNPRYWKVDTSSGNIIRATGTSVGTNETFTVARP